jgi:peptidyl-prolyl cis-trans isomerase C
MREMVMVIFFQFSCYARRYCMIRKNVNKLALLCTLALGGGSALAADNDVVVRYEDTTVNVADIKSAWSSLPPETADVVQRTYAPASSLASEIIVRKVIAARARAAGLDADPEVAIQIQQAVEKTLYDNYMERQGRASVDPKLVERLAREEFRASPEKFRHGEEVHIRHILVKTCECGDEAAKAQARIKAESILGRLKLGESFDDIARAESNDTNSAIKGGDLGFLSRGQTVEPFETAAFALTRVGELSAPVETQFGFHILRLEARKTGGLPTFEEVRESLTASITRRLIKEARSKIVTPLREPGALNIDAAALRAAVDGSWSEEPPAPSVILPDETQTPAGEATPEK